MLPAASAATATIEESRLQLLLQPLPFYWQGLIIYRLEGRCLSLAGNSNGKSVVNRNGCCCSCCCSAKFVVVCSIGGKRTNKTTVAVEKKKRKEKERERGLSALDHRSFSLASAATLIIQLQIRPLLIIFCLPLFCLSVCLSVCRQTHTHTHSHTLTH